MDERKIDWKECCNRKIAKSVKIDGNMIASLKKSSENKLISSNELKINEATASSKFILAYDSLREILEALSLKNSFKIYNHECYTAFLKEILNQSSKGDDFDEIRKIRNRINYYGENISVGEAQVLIIKTIDLRNFILELLNKN